MLILCIVGMFHFMIFLTLEIVSKYRVYMAEDPPMVASRVEIGTPRGYLKPYLDTTTLDIARYILQQSLELTPFSMFFGALFFVGGVGSAVFLCRYRKKSIVVVTCEGVVLGGRLVRWGDVEDVKAWSESVREAEVESSPVIGYGMYGYAVGRTTPSTFTYRSHKYVVLQFFHRNGVETAYFAKQEYWPFVKTVSGIPNQRGTVPNWFQELEKTSFR
jgi:hypothetical protein